MAEIKSPKKINAKSDNKAKPAGSGSAKEKWVYTFGDGKAEGTTEMRNLLGGKGANLAEMANLGLPVPPGFTITTEVCTYYYANDKTYPPNSRTQVEAGARPHRQADGQDLRRSAESAAGVGALRRARLDAGHDGHGAQSRPQRRDRRGPGEALRRSAASPTIPIAASSRCIPMSCSASSTITSRKSWRTTRSSKGYVLDTDLAAEDWQTLVGRYKER